MQRLPSPPITTMNLRHHIITLPREVRDTLLVLVVVAWVIAPLTTQLPLWASAMALGILAWRGWVGWHQKRLPNRWVMGALLLTAIGATLWTHQTIVGRDAGVTLTVMLLSLKTLEMRARRDALVVFFLGFFTLLSNFFFSQSLLTALAILIGVLGLLTALINSHMPVGKPPLKLSVMLACRMALLGAPIMGALFVFFPRIGPLWGMPSDGLSGRSGLSGQMRVGAMANIALNESIAMRIQWLTPQGAPPEQPHLYFRGPVLSNFDGTEWRRLGEDINGEWIDSIPVPAQLQVQGEGIRYRVTLEPHRQPWLLVMDAVPERPTLPADQKAFMTADLQWLNTQPVMDVMRYEATSYPQFRHGPQQASSLDKKRLRIYTELPAGFNPRTLALAQSMRNDPTIISDPNTDNTRKLINAALQRLRTGGYNYTLEPGVYGRNTADEFWFDRKEGFCEHIASAFVVLMRAMDIPARIVTGYQGGELNPVDGYWTIRQSDAHAWSEVWIHGEGWVRIDPTSAVAPGRTGAFQRLRPPRGALGGAMDAMISPGMLQNMRAVWEAVNNRWNQWVLNYSQNRQMDLLKSLGFSSPSWTDLAKVLAGLLALVACGAAAWIAWERQHQDPWLRLLQNARQKLAKHGLPLPHNMPPRTMAQRVTTHFGDNATPIAQWLLQLEQYRYAVPPSSGTATSPHTAKRKQLSHLQKTWRALNWPVPHA